MELQPPQKPHGKRMKPCPLKHEQRIVGLATFGLIITMALALVVGAGATDSQVMGTDALGLSTYILSTTGLLVNAALWPGPPVEGSLTLALRPPHNTSRLHVPSLAAALVSTEPSPSTGGQPSLPMKGTGRIEKGG